MPNARSAKSTREKAAALRAEAERQAARRRTLLAALAVVAVIIIAVGATITVRTLSDQKKEREAAASAPPANVYQPAGAVASGFLVGSSTPKVKVDLYSDYMCPICGLFEKKYGPLLKQYSKDGKITLVLHPVAILDRASKGTEYSTRAANAMATVINTSSKEVALAYHESLFANQPEEDTAGLSDDVLLDLAVKAGANRTAIEQDIRKVRFRSWVTTITDKFAKAYAPGGTPTIVLDGKKLDNATLDSLQAQLDAAIKG